MADRTSFSSVEQKAVMILVSQVVRAAYEEAMKRHGMLPSTIAVITTYAEENLAELEKIPDGE